MIDEQHRFGVLQRQALAKKGQRPHILVMTATPIPRTLTLTLYGDLDVSILDELPPGRKPIVTHWKTQEKRNQVYAAAQRLLSEGRQVYVVCPLVEESEKLQAKSATQLSEHIAKEVFPQYRVGLLHGQMKSEEKDAVMRRFKAHELDILVSTTVIEVGIDVPNASVIIIEDADRFGLAQLHQLRGRVGRGAAREFLHFDVRTQNGGRAGAHGSDDRHAGRFQDRRGRPETARAGRVLRNAAIGDAGNVYRRHRARHGYSDGNAPDRVRSGRATDPTLYRRPEHQPLRRALERAKVRLRSDKCELIHRLASDVRLNRSQKSRSQKTQKPEKKLQDLQRGQSA